MAYKDEQNDIAGTAPSPDVENGGSIPNASISWEAKAHDRMEGNIKGKNKESVFKTGDRNQVKQNTGKPVKGY